MPGETDLGRCPVHAAGFTEQDNVNQAWPSAFRRWHEREFGRTPNVGDAPDEAMFKAWMAGYENCFQRRGLQ